MRINVFALIAAAVTLFALFLPWLSFDQMLIDKALTQILTSSFSPFQYVWGFQVLNGSTNPIVSDHFLEYYSEPKPCLYSLNVRLADTPFVFMFGVALLYLVAIGLMVQASFAGDSWSRAGKRASIAASNLLFLSIFLYALSVGWILIKRVLALCPGGSNCVFYLDLGFWTAILGTGLAFVSWLHPKFINLDAKVDTGTVHVFKRWLPVAEWKKTALMAFASFLPVFIFAIFYLRLP